MITDIRTEHRKATSIGKCTARKTICLVRDRGLLSKGHLFAFKATTKYLRSTLAAEAPTEDETTVTQTTQLFGGMSS